jgi:hypothetical protein
MAYFQYKQDAQSKFQPNASGEPFLKVDKKKQFTLDTKQDSTSVLRVLPPWSHEGLFARATAIHWRVGINSIAFVCPNTVFENECLFCRTKQQFRSEWEKYQADLTVIGARDRYYSNIINLQNPGAGPLVFGYGPQIYGFLLQFQQSGQFGDITDPMYGRDINISRTVRGKKIVDVVYPSGQPTSIMNPEWLDQMTDLDTILPEPDLEAMVKAWKSHPWKVINPDGPTTVVMPPPANVTSQVQVNPNTFVSPAMAPH